MSRIKQGERGRDVPDSRGYIHRACGGTTVVSGPEFAQLSSPFCLCTGTYCAACRKMVSLDKVAWADTGELISAFRLRHWNDSPKRTVRPLAAIGVPLAAAALGALSGWLFAPIKPRGITIGAILGGVIAFFVVMPMGNRVDRGIDYRGEK